MVGKTYNNTSHFAENFQKLAKLRESEEMCDIYLRVANKKISAHKLVLVSVSVFFENLIYGLFVKDLGENEIKLDNIQYEILFAIVNFMYTGEIKISSESVFDIYTAADCYQMNTLKRMCLDSMQEIVYKHNCVKIWIMANNCKHKKLKIEAGNLILSNLGYVSQTKEFLSLSNAELVNLFELWPEQELSDLVISSLISWVGEKEECEKTLIKILNNISHTRVSKDYLENVLSKDRFIQNSTGCSKWMKNISEEKLKLENENLKLQQAESDLKLKLDNEKLQNELYLKQKYKKFLSKKPIIFLTQKDDSDVNEFYLYNCHGGEISIYSSKKYLKHQVCDCITYKQWVYVVGDLFCQRFPYDDCTWNTSTCVSVFEHEHGAGTRVAVLNDTMYICGGFDSEKKCSSIDLNTKQFTSFSLCNYHMKAGVAASDTAIYIHSGQNIAERFDPREGRSTQIAILPFCDTSYDINLAAVLDNQLYCTNGCEYKMLDLRNVTYAVGIKTPKILSNPFSFEPAGSLLTSHGKLYTTFGKTIFEYIEESDIWQNLGSFPELSNIICATSFQ